MTKKIIESKVLNIGAVRDMLKSVKLNDDNMAELINVSFEVDEEFILREPNKAYIKRELEWYTSQSRYVEDIPGTTPKIWLDVSSDKGEINSNYGWCIFSADNGFQYVSALNTLKNDVNSRRSIMIYTRPSIQTEWNTDNMRDFICTNNVQCFIRNNKLIYIVNQRSCDAVFGFNNDYAWHKHVYKMLKNDLKETYPDIKSTNINFNIGSLHVYPRHQDLLKD